MDSSVGLANVILGLSNPAKIEGLQSKFAIFPEVVSLLWLADARCWDTTCVAMLSYTCCVATAYCYWCGLLGSK